jgi:glycerol uptake facilitator-like aquaporin
MSYNSNLPMPTVLEVDKTVKSFQELRNINGQSYVTITAAEGRKLMQRVPRPTTGAIERVLAKGKEDDQIEDEHPEFILIESKDYRKRQNLRSVQGAGGEFLRALLETSTLQLKSLSFYQALIAEFIGVFILTLVVCGLGIKLDNDSVTPNINGALGGGLTLATMIWFTNSISGGNLNPAISIALMLTSELNILRGILFIVFQLLGAISGAATLYALVPAHAQSQISLTLVGENVSLLKAFGVEYVITFVLALTVFACIDKTRKDLGGSFPLAIGLSVTCGALFGVIKNYLTKVFYQTVRSSNV